MKNRIGRLLLTLIMLAAMAGAAACSGSDGAEGAAGTSCTVEQDADTGTATITCDDGTEAVVERGADGADGADGTTCTVDDNGDGSKTISCDDGTQVIVTDGESGADGSDGADGVAGADGVPGGSCTVTDNGDGSHTIDCEDGSSVTVADGADGEAGLGVEINEFHGTDALLNEGEFVTAGKFFVDVTVTGATADANGIVTIDFAVANRADGAPVVNLEAASANIAKLVPADVGVAWNQWVAYIYRQQTIVAGDWPNPEGTSAWQPTSENNGTLTNNEDGSYTYTFASAIPRVYEGGPAITFERNLTHRVSIMLGGHAGATGTGTFDFVPDGSAITETREIIETETCRQCHSWNMFAHGGNRLTTENCVTCHNPGNTDPNSGNTVDFKVMIHKIHMGGELPGIAGDDGFVFDNPATGDDESADNGEYAIWGNRDSKAEWSEAEFPAVIDNCTKCHQGNGAQVDNWRTNPSRAACGSCHSDVDFAVGTNHGGGAQANDNGCTLCHPADGFGFGKSITDAHDWLAEDPRKIPEFTVDLTMSEPANGEYFVDGEAPLVTVVLHDAETGELIDHTTVAEDATAEGCTLVDADNDDVWDPCGRDGLFRTLALFVSGPRALREPVLGWSARAQMFSTVTAPFTVAAAGNLVVNFDQGRTIHSEDAAGGDLLLAGSATIAFAVGSYTADQVVTALNANTAFAARAIAWNDAGRVGIRSRNLGPVHAISVAAGAINTAIFNDTTVHLPTGFTTANDLRARTNPANNDPQATRTAGSITYQLDAVDDLVPGTYVAKLEIADAGNNSDADFRTPSVARMTFQVGQADEELPIARNCNTCHENATGQGFILDWRRHQKHFDDTALDTCGSCHDYQPQNATSAGGGTLGWTGSRPISRRVHAVHNGSEMNYPLWSVDYANGDPVAGRAWRIEFPQNIRNCEVCHTAETSGTWLTNPNRLACVGCHDSDAAVAHIRAQTFDPTPLDPWSGDEMESCATCHAVR